MGSCRLPSSCHPTSLKFPFAEVQSVWMPVRHHAFALQFDFVVLESCGKLLGIPPLPCWLLFGVAWSDPLSGTVAVAVAAAVAVVLETAAVACCSCSCTVADRMDSLAMVPFGYSSSMGTLGDRLVDLLTETWLLVLCMDFRLWWKECAL